MWKAGETGRRGGENDLPPPASLSMRPGDPVRIDRCEERGLSAR
jgi:hypothetical protein